MKLYKLKTIKYLIKTIGFYIVKPDGKRLHDVYPVTIVKELNRLRRRIKRLEDAGDEAIYKTNLFDREAHWFKAKEDKS